MVEDKRLLLVEANGDLGQFVEQYIEDTLGGEDTDVSVSEIDPNAVPDDVIEVEN